jgi:hypothetical protein
MYKILPSWKTRRTCRNAHPAAGDISSIPERKPSPLAAQRNPAGRHAQSGPRTTPAPPRPGRGLRGVARPSGERGNEGLAKALSEGPLPDAAAICRLSRLQRKARADWVVRCDRLFLGCRAIYTLAAILDDFLGGSFQKDMAHSLCTSAAVAFSLFPD